MIDLIAAGFITTGLAFFLAGSIGLLRLPDIYTRLHALTKADNLGLGLLTIGLILQVDTGLPTGKLLLIWLLVMAASSVGSHLIARRARAEGISTWSP
jgi:multicomponent Na+:H+ antiporter subunit G